MDYNFKYGERLEKAIPVKGRTAKQKTTYLTKKLPKIKSDILNGALDTKYLSDLGEFKNNYIYLVMAENGEQYLHNVLKMALIRAKRLKCNCKIIAQENKAHYDIDNEGKLKFVSSDKDIPLYSVSANGAVTPILTDDDIMKIFDNLLVDEKKPEKAEKEETNVPTVNTDSVTEQEHISTVTDSKPKKISKSNLIGTKIKDSVVFDYDDNGVYVKDINGYERYIKNEDSSVKCKDNSTYPDFIDDDY